MTVAIERTRIRWQLLLVARRLSHASPGRLTPAQCVRRRAAIRHLNRYALSQPLPRNTYRPGRIPVFVDDRGSRCAVAHLMTVAGEHALVELTRSTANLARVREMDDPSLARWGEKWGLTVDELADIQPEYAESVNLWFLSFAGVAALAVTAVAVKIFKHSRGRRSPRKGRR